MNSKNDSADPIEFRPGDVVKLKCGLGPEMVYNGNVPSDGVHTVRLVSCFWFTTDGTYQRADFREDMLIMAKDISCR